MAGLKALVVLLAVLAGVWVWKQRHLENHSRKSPLHQGQKPKSLENMVRCGHCGLHLPQGDAVAGRRGWYCSAAHRQAAEGAP